MSRNEIDNAKSPARAGLFVGAMMLPRTPSLRAQRSNPESLRGDSLDCFVARAPRNDDDRDVRQTDVTVCGETPLVGRVRSEPTSLPPCAAPR
ncbi:hypothetical protein GPL17_26140 [Bradyrhizobium yuanmingense]|nr:hypothetical protein [Bradyrhizobium yuanmingense]